MATKMTKRDYFNILLTLNEVQSDSALVGFIEHEIELLERKNSGEHKPTKTQVANEALKDAIFDGMEVNRLYQAKELVKELDVCSELTVQKVSAMLRQMVAEKRVTRSEEKNVTYFTVVK